MDGSLIDAWASLKSFKAKDSGTKDEPPDDDPGNPTVNFHGEKRSNETHASTTDPEAKLMRKGNAREAKLSYSAKALMENGNGLLVDLRIEPADGCAERRATKAMLDAMGPRARRITLGADKGYDAAEFCAACRERNVTPHVAQHTTKRSSRVDGRTVRHRGYEISQRKLVEEIFGCMKTVAGFKRTRYRGLQKTQLAAYFVGAAYNLLRIAKMQPA